MSRGLPIPPGPEGWPNKLEYDRAIRGLSISAIARRAEVSEDSVSRACRGGRLTFPVALRISEAVYSIPPDDRLVALYGPDRRPAA